MKKHLSIPGFVLWVACIAAVGFMGCKKFEPPAASKEIPFRDRILTESHGDLTVSVGIPTRAEAKLIFGTDLYARKIQPVWLKVENRSRDNANIFPSTIDPKYYSSIEAAYRSRVEYPESQQIKREVFFDQISIDFFIPPQSSRSGYVFTNVHEGSKFFMVDILKSRKMERFEFMVEVPGLNVDYYDVDFASLYQPSEIRDLTLEELRAEIEKFPCCTFSKKGALIGDPVNLVVIGEGKAALAAFVRSGWRETERQKGQVFKVLKAYLNKSRYDYAPMSDLWLFNRPQDAGFQKPRATPHERNHFRLWLTPWTYQGKPVWIGAISRDIGLRYTTKSKFLFITHKIDSDVDETRNYLLEDLASAGAVEKFGFAKGVGEVSMDHPKLNPMNDPWWSDGLRLVVFIGDGFVDITDIKRLDWDQPPEKLVGEVIPLVKP